MYRVKGVISVTVLVERVGTTCLFVRHGSEEIHVVVVLADPFAKSPAHDDTRKSSQAIGHTPATMSKTSRYLFGMIFGFSGFVFLVIVGALLKLQPAFVHGAKNPKKTANACFEAAVLYGVLSGLCYTLYKREKSHSGDLGFITETIARRNSYYEIEDSEEELPLAQHMSPMERHYTGSPESNNVRSV